MSINTLQSLIGAGAICASILTLGGCQREEPVPTQPKIGTTTGTTTGTSAPVTPAPVTPAPDNSANNKADATGDTKTPLDQSEASEDIKITAAIRRAILEEKGMSINGQNCKVITEAGGVVTLRGVANTQAEKDRIGVLARAVAGVTRVENQLEVKAG